MRGDETSTISGFLNPAERTDRLAPAVSPLPESGFSSDLFGAGSWGVFPRKKEVILCHQVSFLGKGAGVSCRFRERAPRRRPFLEERVPLADVYSDDIVLIYGSGTARNSKGNFFGRAMPPLMPQAVPISPPEPVLFRRKT